MATSREVDSIGTFEAGAALTAYTFVVLDATTGGWIPCTTALAAVDGAVVGVVQQDGVIGQEVNVMIKGQTKLVFDTAVLSGAAANAGDLFAPIGVGAAGAPAVAAGTAVLGSIFEQVAVNGNIGSIFLSS